VYQCRKKISTTNARMATTTKNFVLVCLILLGLTYFSESQGTESFMRVHHQMGGSSKLPGDRKVPGLMPGWTFLLLLFSWVRNFTPVVSATQL